MLKLIQITLNGISLGVPKIRLMPTTSDFWSEAHSRLRKSMFLNQKDQPTIGKYLVADLLNTLDPCCKNKNRIKFLLGSYILQIIDKLTPSKPTR